MGNWTAETDFMQKQSSIYNVVTRVISKESYRHSYPKIGILKSGLKSCTKSHLNSYLRLKWNLGLFSLKWVIKSHKNPNLGFTVILISV